MSKILIVDDDDALRNLMRTRLAGTYEVIDTGDPVQALGLALQHKPDAILLDLMMPNIGGLEMLTDLGIGLDVVQHKNGDDPLFINTAFLVQCARGILIWVIATLLAFPFARFYHQPAIIALAAVASVSVLLRGFAGGSVWILLRHVQIGKLTTLNVSSDFIGFVVSVIWALISPTAWALVAGRVATGLAYMIGSHLIPGHVASLKWDRSAARDIMMFGTGIFLSSATYFLSGEAERLVIAKFVTVAALGCFSLALSLSGAAPGVIMQVAGQVFFPMISKALREDRSRATAVRAQEVLIPDDGDRVLGQRPTDVVAPRIDVTSELERCHASAMIAGCAVDVVAP